MEYAAWNTLHDGGLDLIRGNVPGDVSVQVRINYLTDEMPTSVDYIVVLLQGCTKFEFQPYDGKPITELSSIEQLSIGILEAQPKDGQVIVYCDEGKLLLAYRDISTYMAEGQLLPQKELEEVADRYWSAFGEHKS